MRREGSARSSGVGIKCHLVFRALVVDGIACAMAWMFTCVGSYTGFVEVAIPSCGNCVKFSSLKLKKVDILVRVGSNGLM